MLFIYHRKIINKMNEITLKEFSEIFKYIIENNKRLENEGKKTTAIGLTSAPGIGN